MITFSTGKLPMAVWSFGGFLVMGNKLFAVPVEPLRLDEDEQHFILDVDKQKLRMLRALTNDNWPDMAIPVGERRIFSYYGVQPYWETHKEEKTLRRRQWPVYGTRVQPTLG